MQGLGRSYPVPDAREHRRAFGYWRQLLFKRPEARRGDKGNAQDRLIKVGQSEDVLYSINVAAVRESLEYELWRHGGIRFVSD